MVDKQSIHFLSLFSDTLHIEENVIGIKKDIEDALSRF